MFAVHGMNAALRTACHVLVSLLHASEMRASFTLTVCSGVGSGTERFRRCGQHVAMAGTQHGKWSGKHNDDTLK
jgi:hypothetical protein